jgi:hypothetical protein
MLVLTQVLHLQQANLFQNHKSKNQIRLKLFNKLI